MMHPSYSQYYGHQPTSMGQMNPDAHVFVPQTYEPINPQRMPQMVPQYPPHTYHQPAATPQQHLFYPQTFMQFPQNTIPQFMPGQLQMPGQLHQPQMAPQRQLGPQPHPHQQPGLQRPVTTTPSINNQQMGMGQMVQSMSQPPTILAPQMQQPFQTFVPQQQPLQPIELQTLIVSNFEPRDWSGTKLKNAFRCYGTVCNVFMGKKAYVVMPNSSEASFAVTQLQLKHGFKIEKAHSGENDESSQLKADLLESASSALGDGNGIIFLTIFSRHTCDEIDRALQDLFYGKCTTKDKLVLLHLVKDACSIKNSQECQFLVKSFETYFFGLLASSEQEDIYKLMILLVTLPQSIAVHFGRTMVNATSEKYPAVKMFCGIIQSAVIPIVAPPSVVQPDVIRSPKELPRLGEFLAEENDSEALQSAAIQELFERPRSESPESFRSVETQTPVLLVNFVKHLYRTYNHLADDVVQTLEEGVKVFCQICGKCQVNILFNCKHMACHGCSSKLIKCPVCQTDIKSKSKIIVLK